MKRHLAMVLLSNTLLLGFALAWLLLIFVPILAGPENYMGIWYENNMAILATEVAICLFGIIWSVIRIIATIRMERRHYVQI